MAIVSLTPVGLYPLFFGNFWNLYFAKPLTRGTGIWVGCPVMRDSFFTFDHTACMGAVSHTDCIVC